jgi:uncharacterized protein YqjF (DUF2071 family)
VPNPFLTASWRHLAMLNYRVDSDLLAPYVPRGTELDAHGGATWLSLVGFLFADTRLLGLRVPYHVTFEELNLRFYVRRTLGDEVRRGVVFIKELVPRQAIALVARLVYNEPYVSRRMGHHVVKRPKEPLYVSYSWEKRGGGWGHLTVETSGNPESLVTGSAEEFITEHYWGYTRQRDGGTIEYRVEHPSWRVWQTRRATVTGDLEQLYGRTFAEILSRPPDSAFLADGSAVVVYRPTRIA